MTSAFWWSDWAYRDGVVSVKSTGHRLPLRRELITTCLRWLLFYAGIQIWRLASLAKRGPRVAFLPQQPRPWYFIWACLHVIGGRVVKDPNQADITIYFEDTTTGTPPFAFINGRKMNFACADISKSRVDMVFERVFGYSMAIDPTSYKGPIVEKSEINGAHDGQIVQGPLRPRPGKVYQRLVDNRIGDTDVLDYRCVVVGQDIPLVFTKQRSIVHRFKNVNDRVLRHEVKEAFAYSEVEKLIAFANEIGLEWGAIDVLRNREDGRIYIVDVNKTNIDPPVAMPLKDKLKATASVAKSLERFVNNNSRDKAAIGSTPYLRD